MLFNYKYLRSKGGINLLLLFFCLFINFRYSYSQPNNLKVEKISLEHGLSQVNVRCILQDKNGFMWFGTQDGLNRYDGYEFVKFKWDPSDSNSIPGNLISSLIEDDKGNIWIGTMGGLAVYNPFENRLKKIDHKKDENDLLPGNISALCKSKDGSVWISDYSLGLFKYDLTKNKFTIFQADPLLPAGLEDNIITAVIEDKNQNVWIGTFSKGLVRYDPYSKSFTKYKESINGLSSNSITSLCIDEDYLYIGTMNGLNVLNTKTGTVHKYNKQPNISSTISSNHILTIYKDIKGNIWLGTENGGLNLFNPTKKQFTRIMHEPLLENSITDNTIYSIFRDKSDNLWLGTSSSGINKINLQPNKFNSISKKNDIKGLLKNYSIRSLLVDNDENLWLGTDFGLYRFDSTRDKVTSYFFNPNDDNSINDNKVWAITQDRNGDVWIGTQRGLARFNKKKENFSRFVYSGGSSEKLPVFIIRSLYADKNNTIWFGTYGAGLFSFSPVKNQFTYYFEKIKEPAALNDLVIFQIFEDERGNLWLVAPSGLASYNPATNEYKRFFSGGKDDRPSDYQPLYSLLEYDKKNFWLGTLGNGFVKFDRENLTYSTYNEKSGLANNVVYAILPDRQNNLWIATNNGISKFKITTGAFKNFDMNDGLPGNEFNTGAYFIDKKGILYFGSTDGLVYFNPDSLVENQNPPQIAVTNFRIFDKPVSLNKVYLKGDEIELAYDDNYFSLEFAALDFTSPAKNKYAYMLEGYDKKWIFPGKRRYAAYTNLDAETYKFLVKASNNDGYWSSNNFYVQIKINPPYWETWWFRLLAVSLLVLTGGLLYSKRIDHLRKEALVQQRFSKQLIESQEAERYRIASELHDGLGQNLIAIINRAKMALKKPDYYSASNQLEAISETALDSIEEVRRIARNLHPYQLNSIGLTKTIEGMLEKLNEATDLKIAHDIDNIDETFDSEEKINIFRIVQEAMNNVIKHASADTARVIIKIRDKGVNIAIEDDGRGIKEEELSNILKLSKGFGLLGMRQRVDFLKGTFNISSIENKGTIISVHIPDRKK